MLWASLFDRGYPGGGACVCDRSVFSVNQKIAHAIITPEKINIYDYYARKEQHSQPNKSTLSEGIGISPMKYWPIVPVSG